MFEKQLLINDFLQEKYRGLLKLNYAIEHGVVKNWESMELIWRNIFEDLKVNPKEHPVLLTEPPNNPFANRQRIAEIFFEKFDVPQLFFHTTPALALYSKGLTSGTVLDVGDGCCHASAISNGFAIVNATQRINLGGRDITSHLMTLLQKAGFNFHSTTDFQIVRQMKEQFCFVE